MPNFFEQVDATGVVENHIKEVLRLEEDQARSILESYRDVRQDLVDKLSRAPRGSFTAQHLRGTLAQVEGAIVAINKHLNGAMIQGAYVAALKGVNHLVKELNVFDEKFTGAVTPINLNAAVIAHDTSQLLVTRYKTNLHAYGVDLNRQISNGLFAASIGESNYEEVVGTISQFFHAEEWKLHRIIRTELHGIYNRGKIDAMTDLIESGDLPDLKKTLMHPMDARTGDDSIYAAQKHLVAEMDEPFEYTWNRKVRSFMTPPDRPNDRAIMVPYRSEWGKSSGSAFIPMNSKG